MAISLDRIAGFADVPDSVFVHDELASGLNLSRVSQNAESGMYRTEVFKDFYKNGDTIPLPVSGRDGYRYTASELRHKWGVQDTRSPSTGWISGPDSLLSGNWKVQNWDDNPGADNSEAGKVFCEEMYRRSGNNDETGTSNDGILYVLTVGQRQRATLFMADEADAYVDVDDALIATDKPLTEALAQGLNRNAKFGNVNLEFKYLGEFVDGDTVPQPISQADGLTYSYAECALEFSWRWTTDNSVYSRPDKSLGQLGPIKASIDGATGAVSVSVEYINDSNTTLNTHGRIAVFAWCSRSDLIDTIPGTADEFAAIDLGTFMPGEKLKASALLQLNKNVREAACSPERFGPTEYEHGDTIPVPTSTIDGYVYARDEIVISAEWSDTSPQTGANLRTAGFYFRISDTTGTVFIVTWRLPPGGPYDPTHSFAKLLVTVFAQRGAAHPVLVPASDGSADTPADIGSAVVDVTGPDKAPYAIACFTGDTGVPPTANQILIRHYIPDSQISGVDLDVNFAGAYGSSINAATSTFVITVKKNGTTTIGTMTISASGTTMAFSAASADHIDPGEFYDFVAPATPDATAAGFSWTIPGVRT